MMKFLKQREIAIGGYAETPIRRRGGQTALELAAEALTMAQSALGETSMIANVVRASPTFAAWRSEDAL